MSSKKKEVAPVSTNDQNGPRPEDMKSAANFVLDIDEGKTLECNDSQVDSPSEEEKKFGTQKKPITNILLLDRDRQLKKFVMEQNGLEAGMRTQLSAYQRRVV